MRSCIDKNAHPRTHTDTHTHTYVWLLPVRVSVCLAVCCSHALLLGEGRFNVYVCCCAIDRLRSGDLHARTRQMHALCLHAFNHTVLQLSTLPVGMYASIGTGPEMYGGM